MEDTSAAAASRSRLKRRAAVEDCEFEAVAHRAPPVRTAVFDRHTVVIGDKEVAEPLVLQLFCRTYRFC